VEGDCRCIPGLGLLPVRTVLTGEKVTRQVKFRFRDEPTVCEGYEIHMGRTEAVEQPSPSCRILAEDTLAEVADGYYVDAQCFGSYIHGILDNPSIVDRLLSRFQSADTLAPAFSYRDFKEQQYDLLAERVRGCLDMEKLYECLKR
jgi:adenosylcobyric acid synthase